MQRVLFFGLLLLFGYLLYLIFSPFLVPLTWAVLLVIVFFPVHQRVRDRIPQTNRAALVTTLLLTLLIVVPALAVMGAFTAQAVELVQWAQLEWREGRVPFRQVFERFPTERLLNLLAEYNIDEEQVNQFVNKELEELGRFIAAQAGRLVRNAFIFLFDLFIMLLAAFYLFRDGGGLLERFRRALPLEAGVREGLFYIAHTVLYASVMSGLVVAAVQGALGGLLFWLLGIGAPVLWGIVMAFLSLLPLVGAWLVWVPAGVYLLLQAQYLKAIILFAVGALVISTIDNVLRPVLVSGRTQMNGLLVFISILGGVAAFGLLGILLGPILVALGATVIEYYTTLRPTMEVHPPPPPPPAPAQA
jgi:predicted PurR-regulated permease PerM